LNIGEPVWTKIEGKVVKCFVIKCMDEEIEVSDGNKIFVRKYWEVCKNGER